MSLLRVVMGAGLSLVCLASCQSPPTRVVDRDQFVEEKSFASLEAPEQVDFRRAVIIDVRGPFAHSLARLPRSFSVLVDDWNLDPYSGADLDKKRRELQKLLALKGIDPWTGVVILGEGLEGQGEEFLLAVNLVRLGIQRISFLTSEMAKMSLRARDFPELRNVPNWDKPLGRSPLCSAKSEKWQAQQTQAKVDGKTSLLTINAATNPVSALFGKDLKLRRPIPKAIRQVESPGSYWAYGLVLQNEETSSQLCVAVTSRKKKESSHE